MKILVISLAGIGDTLFVTPLIHELRANFPDAIIDALVKERGAKDLLENNPHLNRVFHKNLLSDSKISSLIFLSTLRGKGYHISISTFPQSRRHYRLVAKFISAPVRLSHRYENFSAFDDWLTNKTIPVDYSLHAVENNLALLSRLDAKPKLSQYRYELFLTDIERIWADNFVAREKLSGRPMFGIHVGSGGTKNLGLRRWPLENYIELVRQLRKKEPGLAILFFGGPEEKTDHEKIRSTLGEENLFFPKTENLRQAAALIGKCDIFLSVDTALMHLAAAMKVRRQIIIETPTWNKPIEPYGNPFTLVKNPAVAGRNLEFYRYDGRSIRGSGEELQRYMKSVTVEMIFMAVEKALR